MGGVHFKRAYHYVKSTYENGLAFMQGIFSRSAAKGETQGSRNKNSFSTNNEESRLDDQYTIENNLTNRGSTLPTANYPVPNKKGASSTQANDPDEDYQDDEFYDAEEGDEGDAGSTDSPEDADDETILYDAKDRKDEELEKFNQIEPHKSAQARSDLNKTPSTGVASGGIPSDSGIPWANTKQMPQKPPVIKKELSANNAIERAFREQLAKRSSKWAQLYRALNEEIDALGTRLEEGIAQPATHPSLAAQGDTAQGDPILIRSALRDKASNKLLQKAIQREQSKQGPQLHAAEEKHQSMGKRIAERHKSDPEAALKKGEVLSYVLDYRKSLSLQEDYEASINTIEQRFHGLTQITLSEFNQLKKMTPEQRAAYIDQKKRAPMMRLFAAHVNEGMQRLALDLSMKTGDLIDKPIKSEFKALFDQRFALMTEPEGPEIAKLCRPKWTTKLETFLQALNRITNQRS